MYFTRLLRKLIVVSLLHLFFRYECLKEGHFDSVSFDLNHGPCKHVISCQYWACTGPMLAASAQYRPGTGT